MTITLTNGQLGISADFASAFVGPFKSHGVATIGATKYQFKSAFDQEATYRALVRASEREGKRISSFVSQSL